MEVIERHKKTILMIDDVSFNHATAKDVLGNDYKLLQAMSAKEGFEVLENTIPDLILLDIVMPEMDGMEMLQILKKTALYRNIPVIFLTASTNPESEVEGFTYGIVDYITKPFVPEVMRKRIETHIALTEYEKSLEEKVENKVVEMEKMYDLMATSFAGLVESRDGVTGGHLKNTSIYFAAYISYLKTLPEYRKDLTTSVVKKAIRSAPLHDVGKIAIKDSVLQKPSSLTDSEFKQMKYHAVIGGELFDFLEERIPDKEFARIAGQIAKYHHEKFDGSGYPYGLKGEDIPLVARIMSIVDVYDALTSKRPYKEPFSHDKALELIEKGSGTQFDPNLVKCFMDISNNIKDCLEKKEQMIQKSEFFVSNKDFMIDNAQ